MSNTHSVSFLVRPQPTAHACHVSWPASCRGRPPALHHKQQQQGHSASPPLQKEGCSQQPFSPSSLCPTRSAASHHTR